MTARQNIGKALGEFLAVVLEEIAASLDRHTSRMDAVRPIAPAAATEEPGRVEFNPAAPPPAPAPDDRSCPVEVRGVPCVLPMAHTGAHVDPLGAFLAPFVTVPESDGLEAERMAERGLTDDQADATPVPFVDLGETCGAVSSTGLVCDQPKGHALTHSAAGTVVGWWDQRDPEWPMPDEPAVVTREAAIVVSRNGDRMPAVERALDACHRMTEWCPLPVEHRAPRSGPTNCAKPAGHDGPCLPDPHDDDEPWDMSEETGDRPVKLDGRERGVPRTKIHTWWIIPGSEPARYARDCNRHSRTSPERIEPDDPTKPRGAEHCLRCFP